MFPFVIQTDSRAFDMRTGIMNPHVVFPEAHIHNRGMHLESWGIQSDMIMRKLTICLLLKGTANMFYEATL